MLENSKEELIQWDKSKFNQFSFKLFEKRKQIKLKEIFDLFDSDEDGIISATNIDISRVGVQILELYTPLLCELEELNQTLNLEEFISASEKLLGTLSINEKALVLGLNKKGNDNLIENYSFQPEINMKSHVLAMKKRGNMKEENIYDYYMKEKQVFNF